MRKELLLGMACGAAVTLPVIFSGCRNPEAIPTPIIAPTEQDFSDYVPIIVSVNPSEDICVDDTNETTYHTGDHLKLLELSNSDIIEFQISVENKAALFSRKGSRYVGTVKEGDLFGVLYDAKGRGAQPLGKLVEVDPDSIKIALVTDCQAQSQV